MLEPVRKSLTVNRTPEVAFDFFVRRIADWWPLDTHALAVGMKGEPATSCHIEPRTGGRVYEVHRDGSEADWGVVLAYEPGRRLVLSWELGRPKAQATEVEVTFTEDGPGRTLVGLEHRGWERLEQGGAAMRAGYDQGWDIVLGRRYGDFAEAA